jgi:hypothetical protein
MARGNGSSRYFPSSSPPIIPSCSIILNSSMKYRLDTQIRLEMRRYFFGGRAGESMA